MFRKKRKKLILAEERLDNGKEGEENRQYRVINDKGKEEIN